MTMVVSEIRQATYSNTGMCSTDTPYTVKNANRRKCALECLRLKTCEDLNHISDGDECALFLHKPLFYDVIPGCAGFKASQFIILINVKNFHGSLTTVVRAQNDTTKTANITDTIFDRTLV